MRVYDLIDDTRSGMPFFTSPADKHMSTSRGNPDGLSEAQIRIADLLPAVELLRR